MKNSLFFKDYAQKHKIVLLSFACCSFVGLMTELFISEKIELATMMILLSLSVICFIEAHYPHRFKPTEKTKHIPLNQQILLFTFNIVFVISLIAKFLL